MVQSKDEETGEIRYKPVEDVFVYENRGIYTVTIVSQTESQDGETEKTEIIRKIWTGMI